MHDDNAILDVLCEQHDFVGVKDVHDPSPWNQSIKLMDLHMDVMCSDIDIVVSNITPRFLIVGEGAISTDPI